MDHLHATLAALAAENKSAQSVSTGSHLTVFREFLAQLDRLQPKPPKAAREKPPSPRKPARRGRG